MKEILNRKLANPSQTPYSKGVPRFDRGGDIFMEGKSDMTPAKNQQPANPEHSEAPRGQGQPVSPEKQVVAKQSWERDNARRRALGEEISVDELRTQQMAWERGRGVPSGAQDAIDKTGIQNPLIAAEVDVVNNSIEVGMPPLSVLTRGLENVIRLQGVDVAEKQIAIDKIKAAIDSEKQVEQERGRDPREEQERRYSLYFTPAEQESLRRDPTEWLDTQFNILYRFAEEGQELNSQIINGIQQQVSQAVDFVKNYRPEVMSDFLAQYAVRLHLLQTRTAIGYKNMDQIKGAAGELRFHGLLTGMTLEKGMVGAMFNRFQDLLESVRLSGNTRHHVMLEDAYKLQGVLIREQMDIAKKGVSGFGDLSDITVKEEKDQNPNDSDTWDDFTWATKEDKQIKENREILEGRMEKIMRIKNVNARITRSVRTAYDVFVSSQRLAVVVARGKYLLKDSSRYRSDPIGALNVYNMGDLLFEKFDMYSSEQEELVDRMVLDMADSYLKDQGKANEREQEKLTREQKIDLGKRLFRDIFAVPDFFSSGWRIEGVVQALEERFDYHYSLGNLQDKLLSKLDEKEIEEYRKLKSDQEKKRFLVKIRANDFALFMRLRSTGQDQISDPEDKKKRDDKKREREKIWAKIQDFRPEEIIRLFRERKNNKVIDLYKGMIAVDLSLDLTDEEKLANRSDEEGGRGKDLTAYDKFKKKYGPIIGLLRQEGFSKVIKAEGKDVFAPEQVNLVNLSDEQKKMVDAFLGVDGAKQLMEIANKMQDFISNEKLVDDLLTDSNFADIYTRSIIIDDALLDKLEDEKAHGQDNLGYSPLSKIIGEAGAGGDTLVRSWNDTENAAKAGNALIQFIKEEDVEKKSGKALEFATSASSYNGLGARGQAECIRYTMGTFLNLSKVDMMWDIIGLNSLGRVSISDVQRIFGPHAKAMSRDELRGHLDRLRGYLSSSISKSREDMQEKTKALLEGDLSEKYKEEAKELKLSEDEFKERKKKEWKEKFEEDERKSHKFYEDLENLLEVNTENTVKRFGLRLILYLLLASIGEVYTAGKSSFKEAK